jgi:general secretion pathway protein I
MNKPHFKKTVLNAKKCNPAAEKITNKPHGFTLIEVMVALTIIAIALASIIKASGSHTNSAGYLKSKTLAHYVAMNEITKLQINNSWPDVGKVEKTTEMAGIEWFWTREVEKTGDQSGNIRGLKFSVFMDENKTKQLAMVQAFIANPANKIPPAANGNAANANSGTAK